MPASERLYLRTEAFQLGWPAHAEGESAFRQADPAPELARHVAKLRWGYERIPPGSPIEERIVPDGSIQLLFDLGSPDMRGFVLGARSEPTLLRLTGRIEHLGLELRAGAVPALFGVPARELSGSEVDLDDLWGGTSRELRARLGATTAIAERIRIVQQTLVREIARRDAATPRAVEEALQRIARRSGTLRVRELAAELGMSERRVEQLFQWHVGLSPKVVGRLARFRSSVNRLAAGPCSWADLALECGFVDQSHLVNEFRALTGLSPGQFRARVGFGFLQD